MICVFSVEGTYPAGTKRMEKQRLHESLNLYLSLRIQVCPKKGISPIPILRMGLEPEKSYSIGLGSGFLGLRFHTSEMSGQFHHFPRSTSHD